MLPQYLSPKFVHTVGRPKLKKLIAVCFASLFIFCCSDQMAKLPNCWEYAPGKWIAFKKNIELEWKYGESEIDKFKVDRVKVKLKSIEIKKIMRLVKKNKIDELLAKENALVTKIRWYEKKGNYTVAAEMNYKDKIEPRPAYGEMYFYQVSAIKDHSTSLPAQISVIFLDRSI
jgi:hypothetical protein